MERCNCRKKDLCPLGGACLANNIVYKATVTTASGESRVYIGSTTTRFPSSTASIHMTLSYPNTSGTVRTATPISQLSGQLSRVHDLTGETRHAAIYVRWKNSAFYPLTNQRFSTGDLS